jgi:parvulin-like peptidyl-prolyl isomerase
VNRPFLLAAGALALALTASACSSVGPDAATVNGEGINRRDFEDRLQSYIDNDAYQLAATAQNLPVIVGPGGNGTVSMEFASSQLGRAILLELLQQEVAERGLTVTPEIRQQAADGDAAAFTLPFEQPALDEAWDAFPESFREQAIDDTAAFITLQQALGGPTDEASLRAVYDENPEKFGRLCARHILVSSEAEAEAVLAELEGGADFAALAAQASTDPGSAAQGGALYTDGQPCPLATQFVPAFVDGAAAAAEGEPSQPVQTTNGWHIILVEDREQVPFEEAAGGMRQYVISKGQTAAAEVLRQAAKGDIDVDPRYGTWNPEGPQVQPPGSPT